MRWWYRSCGWWSVFCIHYAEYLWGHLTLRIRLRLCSVLLATLTSSQIKLAELKQWILKAEILWGFLYSSENGDNSMFAGSNQQKEPYALMRFEIVCIPGSNCIESLIHFQTRKSIWSSSVLTNWVCSTSSAIIESFPQTSSLICLNFIQNI